MIGCTPNEHLEGIGGLREGFYTVMICFVALAQLLKNNG